MICALCGRELPAAFPGARVTCACGHETELGGLASGRPRSPPSRGGHLGAADALLSSAPYRGVSRGGGEELARETKCPFCGNGCPPLVRICPHCDVRLDAVRCARCFSLQAPGSFACARCGHVLELEPVLDPSDAPCPRCATPLEAAASPEGGKDARLHECPRCGGFFVPRDVLAEILCRAELGGPLSGAPAGARGRASSAPEEIRYLRCPLCTSTMNRMNFGKLSGVIVDVCREHGTWFDAGELTRVVAFAASGGLAKTRAREAAEKRESERESLASRSAFAASSSGGETESDLAFWRELLRSIFTWP